MLEAGARTAGTRPSEGRIVVAVSLPARAFAAALACAAAVVTTFRDDPPASDAAQHFDYLRSLPEDTAISHHRANKVEQGRLVGVEVGPNDDIPRIRIKLHKEYKLLPEQLCTEIQVIDDPGTLKAHRQTLVKTPDFLAGALPGFDVTSLSATTRLDCVIVGVEHLLHAELTAREFSVRDNGTVHEGDLQSIVRARDISGSKDAYRSAVVPAGSEDGNAPISESIPRLVIFDGARAFNNWHSMWPDSNWFVLLDRGLRSADDGAAMVNQAYARRADDSDALSGLEVPPGIETLAYLDRQ